MLGSAQSIAGPNIVLNTAVADVLSQFADKLEKADDLNAAIAEIIKDTVKKHKRIIFNGNSYSEEWVKESEKRGLLNLRSSADALPLYKSEKNIRLFSKHKVFTKAEVESRCELMLENYIKVLSIEVQTMIGMVNRDILPAVVAYSAELAKSGLDKKALSKNISTVYETALADKLSKLCECLYNSVTELESALLNAKDIEDTDECAKYFSDTVFEKMCLVRQTADELETLVAAKYWPYPIYSDILFSV